MKVLEDINDSQFKELVLHSKSNVLLDCYSPECIICKSMDAKIKELSHRYQNEVLFLRLDVNKNKVWQDYNVRAIPTLLYFKEGQLIFRDDSFPENHEITTKLDKLIKLNKSDADFRFRLKKAIDAECLVKDFYKYLANNTKNGRIKQNFNKFFQEAQSHQELLQNKLKEVFKEDYQPETKRFYSEEKPHSFSLLGAIKMAISTEKDSLDFYRQAIKSVEEQHKELFSKLIEEEAKHQNALKKELKFIKEKEFFSPMEGLDYSSWIRQVWK